ncbi:MAG: hypothetical protein NVS9B1_21370 [Candidatus Dormibacteraceae bacterium]
MPDQDRYRLRETPEAAARSLPFRLRYARHPYLWAGVPVLAGASAYAGGYVLRSALLVAVGLGVGTLGLLIEFLNGADSVWRFTHRR